jgi:hypothetical protein
LWHEEENENKLKREEGRKAEEFRIKGEIAKKYSPVVERKKDTGRPPGRD